GKGAISACSRPVGVATLALRLHTGVVFWSAASPRVGPARRVARRTPSTGGKQMKRALRMFAVAAVATAALSTAGWAQNPQAVMSWGSACPTVVTDKTFTQMSTDGTVPNPYPMYIMAKNLTAADANVGTDINLFYGRGLPDAWRFDDAGCQTG